MNTIWTFVLVVLITTVIMSPMGLSRPNDEYTICVANKILTDCNNLNVLYNCTISGSYYTNCTNLEKTQYAITSFLNKYQDGIHATLYINPFPIMICANRTDEVYGLVYSNNKYMWNGIDIDCQGTTVVNIDKQLNMNVNAGRDINGNIQQGDNNFTNNLILNIGLPTSVVLNIILASYALLPRIKKWHKKKKILPHTSSDSETNSNAI